MMRVFLAITCIAVTACTTSVEQRRSFNRTPVLLDLYAADYGNICMNSCPTPKRYTLLYESGSTGVLRIADDGGERSRRIPAATIARIVRILDDAVFIERSEGVGCIHCRHWLVSVRVVGQAASFDQDMTFGLGNPFWIDDVLTLLGEVPPSNGPYPGGG